MKQKPRQLYDQCEACNTIFKVSYVNSSDPDTLDTAKLSALDELAEMVHTCPHEGGEPDNEYEGDDSHNPKCASIIDGEWHEEVACTCHPTLPNLTGANKRCPDCANYVTGRRVIKDGASTCHTCNDLGFIRMNPPHVHAFTVAVETKHYYIFIDKPANADETADLMGKSIPFNTSRVTRLRCSGCSEEVAR